MQLLMTIINQYIMIWEELPVILQEIKTGAILNIMKVLNSVQHMINILAIIQIWDGI